MSFHIPAAWLHTLDPFAIQFNDSFGIRWYGLAYLAGFYLGYLMILWLSQRGLSLLKPEQVGDFVFNVAIGTIIGGRLGYCIFYDPSLLTRFTNELPYWGVFAINQGGMASHGGIAGLIVAAALYSWRHKVNFSHLLDLTTLGGSIGIFFGRIANFVNGELVGRPSDPNYSWAVKFPQDIFLWPAKEPERLQTLAPAIKALGIQPETWQNWLRSMNWYSIEQTLQSLVLAIQTGNKAAAQAIESVLTPRYPSQLFEAAMEGAFLFLVMIIVWSRPRKPGVIAGIFLILYPLVRIIGEQFRMPDAQLGFQLWGLTRGQWISIAMIGICLIPLIYWLKRPIEKLGGWLNSLKQQ